MSTAALFDYTLEIITLRPLLPSRDIGYGLYGLDRRALGATRALVLSQMQRRSTDWLRFYTCVWRSPWSRIDKSHPDSSIRAASLSSSVGHLGKALAVMCDQEAGRGHATYYLNRRGAIQRTGRQHAAPLGGACPVSSGHCHVESGFG
jgi:hypothetical protein